MSHLRAILPFAGLALAAAAAQLGLRALGMDYCLTQLTMALYYAIVVLALCLLMGYAGQVSLGHAAFFAIGGYTTAFLTTHDFSVVQTATWAGWLKHAHLLVARQNVYGGSVLSCSPWAAFALALLVTAGVALLIGYPALRLRGHYLAMATLGFGLIVNKIVLGTALLGAADGIQGVPEWHLAPGLTVSGKRALRVENYYVACGLMVVTLALLRNLVNSRVGRALRAVHDREAAANALGVDTAADKLRAFVLSALLAATAGVFFTHYTGGIGPSEAGALKSVRYLALAAAGGMASLWGAAAVSTLLNFLSLRGLFGSYDNAVFGAALILIISLAPDGPLQPLGRWLRRLFQQAPAGAASAAGQPPRALPAAPSATKP